MVYTFFDKKTAGSGLSHTIKPVSPNEQLAEEIHKPTIKGFKKKKSVFSIQR